MLLIVVHHRPRTPWLGLCGDVNGECQYAAYCQEDSDFAHCALPLRSIDPSRGDFKLYLLQQRRTDGGAGAEEAQDNMGEVWEGASRLKVSDAEARIVLRRHPSGNQVTVAQAISAERLSGSETPSLPA